MKMIESLQRFNLVDIPVVDFDNTLISGHQRLRALQAIGRGEETIDVRCPNRKLSETELKEYNLLANTHFGEWDEDIFGEFFADVDVEGLGFSADDFKLPDLSIIAPEEPVKLEAKEDDYEVPETIVTDIVTGDLFEIGSHRLLCGDSTNADDVAKLMDNKKIDIVFTSPPYNQGGDSAYTGAYEGKGKKGKRKAFGYVDAKTSNEYVDFLHTVLTNIYLFLNESHCVFWNVMYNANSRREYGLVVFSEKNPLPVQETIIWDKGNGMNICANHILSRSSELIFLLAKSEKYRTNQHKSVYWNTWKIPSRNHMNEGHGAAFPVQLPAKAIEDFSTQNDIVTDPFGGSGTTMVAAHQLARRCYMLEISPQYCQVIVDRMLRLDPTLEIKRNSQPYERRTN